MIDRQKTSETTIQVITSIEEFDQKEAEWNSLVEQTDSHIFQTFEWNRIWWEHYGKGNGLYIIFTYLHGQLIGIVPLFVDNVQCLGLTLYRSLRFIGSNVTQPNGERMLGLNSYTDYLDVIAKPGYEKLLGSSTQDIITEKLSLVDEFIFDYVTETSIVLTHLYPRLRRAHPQTDVRITSSSQRINLSCSWNEYLKSLNKNRRYQARLHLKRAIDTEKKVFNVIDLKTRKEIEQMYERLVLMHQEKWNSHGFLGTFYEKQSYKFHKDITLAFFKKGWLQFKVAAGVDNNHSVTGIDLNYCYSNHIYGAHTAIDDRSPLYKKGPGTVLLNVTLHEAARQGVKTYDFLRGEEAYKLGLANRSVDIHILTIPHPNRLRRLKAICIRNLFYYKRYALRKLEEFKLFVTKDSRDQIFKEFVNRIKKKLRTLNPIPVMYNLLDSQSQSAGNKS